MLISVVNHTNGQITDEALQRTIRAINRQIREDFEPHWSINGELRLEGRSTEQPETVQLADMRGEAIIYLWDQTDIEDALGYHLQNARGIPFGFVFTQISQSIGEPWSVTLSHEALELLADPETNLLVMGPHPAEDREVFHWHEMCDAVQAESYLIDGVAVSNFVLPLYFTGTRDTDEIGGRNDYLGRLHGGQTLKSFGINPGGYIGFFDPRSQEHDTYSIKGDSVAAMRLEMKGRAKQARRSMRYRHFDERDRLRAGERDGQKAASLAKRSALASPHSRLATAPKSEVSVEYAPIKLPVAAKAQTGNGQLNQAAERSGRTPKRPAGARTRTPAGHAPSAGRHGKRARSAR